VRRILDFGLGLAALLWMILSTPIARADALRVTYGYGEAIDLYAIILQLDRRKPVHQYARWTLTSHVDLGIGQFQGHESSPSHQTTRALAGIGTLRWERRPTTPVVPFVEFGLGLSGFSETTIAGIRHLGGGFEFTEILRSGFRFGERRQYEVSLSAQHFSNAGLHWPNEGITYAGVSAAWYFR
jgi:hypothetical protein